MMLLSWQEQEAANDIGVTSFMVSLINGGVGWGGVIDSRSAQRQHARQEKHSFLQHFQVFPDPRGYQHLNLHQWYWVWDLGNIHPV